MHYKVIQKTEIAEELIPMEEISAQLRMYDVHDEELLSNYREAAIDFAESYMNRALGMQSVIATFETYRNRCYLPLGKIVEITTVTALNQYGEEVLLNESDYRFNIVSNELMIKPYCDNYTEFMVGYEVGDIVTDIPKAIKLGILKLITTWYEYREDLSGGNIQEIPFSHKSCFDLYRISPGV